MAFRVRRVLFGQPFKGYVLKEMSHGGKRVEPKTIVNSPPPAQLTELSWALASLNITHIRIPPYVEPIKGIIPSPLPPCTNKIIEPPLIHGIINYEDILPTKTVEEPSDRNVPEKQAARLIIIRKKKMKKHKLKKLRKKMKFEWGKRRQKREMMKEKLFQADLIANMKMAQTFDPAKYAAEKIAKANEVELPPVWHGVKYPDFIIKQLVEEEETKKNEKEADEKRRASMSPYVRDYLKNLPK